MTNNPKRFYRGAIVIVAWFGLVLQLYLMLKNNADRSVLQNLVNFFSYFTILTNILVALATTFSLLIPQTELGKFFSKPFTESALTVYIVMVGVIHFLLLRNIVELKGSDLLADTILHTVMPVLYLLYWLIFVPKGELRWRDSLQWLLFPFMYFMYVLIRGFIDCFYPYPFANVDQLGYAKALMNGGWVLFSFFICGLILSFMDGAIQKSQSRKVQ